MAVLVPRCMLFFFVVLFTSFLCLPSVACCGLKAFPGAEGFGATSKGGRGGRIIRVTNLHSGGPGSLREACAVEGPRTVVFAVGGVIRGDVAIKHSFITIAGQTAPEPGITLEGRLLARPEPTRRLHDIVVRFIRVRPRPATGVGGDAVQLPNTEQVILDHLSLSWGNDEIIDVIYSSEVTVQWCTIEESGIQGHAKGKYHNFGLISAYPGSGNISIHHNLFAHQSRRSPSLTPYVSGKPGDIRNNVVYNFTEGLTHDGHVPAEGINIIGNYYKRGPNSAKVIPFSFHRKGRYYLEGNFMELAGILNDPGNRLPNWIKQVKAGSLLDSPFPVERIETHTAQEAYKIVLNRAGCFPRDRVTKRTVAEVRNGTGAWGRHAPPEPSDQWLLENLAFEDPEIDSDQDGMPDAWEDANGLDKHDAGDHARAVLSGYTAIEKYMNERAKILIEDEMVHQN